MNDEDAFNATLDFHPGDAHLRLVFADWLQERDDSRADAYRVLGTLRLRPSEDAREGWRWYRVHPSVSAAPCELPGDWYDALIRVNGNGVHLPTRRHAEEAAVAAFASLSPERRAELLAQTS